MQILYVQVLIKAEINFRDYHFYGAGGRQRELARSMLKIPDYSQFPILIPIPNFILIVCCPYCIDYLRCRFCTYKFLSRQKLISETTISTELGAGSGSWPYQCSRFQTTASFRFLSQYLILY